MLLSLSSWPNEDIHTSTSFVACMCLPIRDSVENLYAGVNEVALVSSIPGTTILGLSDVARIRISHEPSERDMGSVKFRALTLVSSTITLLDNDQFV